MQGRLFGGGRGMFFNGPFLRSESGVICSAGSRELGEWGKTARQISAES